MREDEMRKSGVEPSVLRKSMVPARRISSPPAARNERSNKLLSRMIHSYLQYSMTQSFVSEAPCDMIAFNGIVRKKGMK